MESASPQSIRATAKLMRHETTTHTTHYGSWIDESELEESVAKFIQGQKAAALKFIGLLVWGISKNIRAKLSLCVYEVVHSSQD